MDGLYERDALAWSEQQAALLRRVANGERVNAAIDWAHVIDEVHDLGQSELHAVDRLLEQAMLHLLKIHLRPGSLAREHWQAEVAAFLDRAEQQYLRRCANASTCREPMDGPGVGRSAHWERVR